MEPVDIPTVWLEGAVCAYMDDPKFTGVIRDKEGDIAYFKDGRWHREDGPALIYKQFHDGMFRGSWFLDGASITFENWLEAIDADEVTKTYYRMVYG